ncbi:uncharacterized protein VTP21DRAFT_1145 [Calcarisporiella thermophila]|uniref:uncharacterized protein n=1 Tax=Calcarisporiella thermophila TaxID=911321 RepID=UPI0037428EFA
MIRPHTTPIGFLSVDILPFSPKLMLCLIMSQGLWQCDHWSPPRLGSCFFPTREFRRWRQLLDSVSRPDQSYE